jgi:hypothetical protein
MNDLKKGIKAMTDCSAEHGGCWAWKGRRDGDGYGTFTCFGESFRAHRMVYELFVGPIPDGYVVMHSCDHPWCVNPEHLSAGTELQNIQDKVSKNRQPRGETNGAASLSESQAIEILHEYKLGSSSYKSLAQRFGVTKTCIAMLIRGEAWKHLNRGADAVAAKRRARITDSEVVEIRKAYAAGEVRSDIARRFGISHSQVTRIVKFKHRKTAGIDITAIEENQDDNEVKRYRVSALVTISIHTLVEAESQKEAIELAADRVCQDANGDPDKEWTAEGDLDGTPEQFTVTELDEYPL